MEGLLNKFGSIKVLYRVLIYIFIFIILGALYYYMIYTPLKDEISKAKNEYDRLVLDISKIKPITLNYEQFKKEIEILDRQFNMLLEILPNEKSYNLLYDQLVSLAERNCLKVVLFQPTNESSIDDFHSKVNFNMNVEGGYLEFVTFLHNLSYLNRVINVNNFTISQRKDQTGVILLTVSMSMNSYMFKQAKGESIENAGKGDKK
ncbi:MAG: type 4a pilus biogenesis protein PilO [Deferribacterales bacterium]